MPDPTTIIDILLVEDNPNDAELCIRALRKHNLANKLLWVKDGAEALDVLCRIANNLDKATWDCPVLC